MFNELIHLKSLIIKWFVVFIISALFFFLFGFGNEYFLNTNIILPSITTTSFAVLFFDMIQTDLLPAHVLLVANGPLSAFNSQTLIALLMAFVITLPLFFYNIAKFILPALFYNERKIIISVLIPTILLFFIGMYFAYSFVIPPSFTFLFDYAAKAGITSLFSIEDFVSTVILFMVSVGVMFTLPVFIVILSLIGIIPVSIWKKNWRYAQFSFLVFSAIITPDGSGVSMVILTLPLMCLYFAGVWVAGIVSV